MASQLLRVASIDIHHIGSTLVRSPKPEVKVSVGVEVLVGGTRASVGVGMSVGVGVSVFDDNAN
jgi:hypothetical protein